MAKSSSREHLIEVGLQRFYADGYSATGINSILEDAGIPKGSFYHYFPSKEAFAIEVLRSYFASETQRAADVLGETKTPPLKRLRKYFKILVAAHGYSSDQSGCLLGILSSEIADHSTDVQRELKSSFDSWQGAISGLLSEAIAEGELPKSADADELAALVLNHWEGAQIRAKADQSDKPLELFLRFTFGTLLRP